VTSSRCLLRKQEECLPLQRDIRWGRPLVWAYQKVIRCVLATDQVTTPSVQCVFTLASRCTPHPERQERLHEFEFQTNCIVAPQCRDTEGFLRVQGLWGITVTKNRVGHTTSLLLFIS
jgi:hypothetical protein